MGNTSDGFWNAGNVLMVTLSCSFITGIVLLFGAIVWIGRLRRSDLSQQDPNASDHPLTRIQTDLQFQLLSGGQGGIRLTGVW